MRPEGIQRTGAAGIPMRHAFTAVRKESRGGPPGEGEIIEVLEADLRVQYRVRWTDGHQSLVAPGPGAARIEPAQDRRQTRSGGAAPKKSRAQASTARKSAAKKASAKTTT